MRLARSLKITEQEYLEGEEIARVKHEYVDGQVYAMAGATKAHGELAVNLATALHGHLRGKKCRTYIADMKVHLANSSAYYYPDVVVTCDAHDLSRKSPENYLENPCLIVEVLSRKTARIDRGEKRLAYCNLASVQEYVLVDQRRQSVEVYRRDGHGWINEILGPGDVLNLTAVDLQIPLATLYEDTDVPGVALQKFDEDADDADEN